MSDVVITTAQVPGKKAPVLLSDAMVHAMKPGSVIVDMAAGQGGNVSLSKPDQTVDAKGVKILGPVNLPSTVAFHASPIVFEKYRIVAQNSRERFRVKFEFGR